MKLIVSILVVSWSVQGMAQYDLNAEMNEYISRGPVIHMEGKRDWQSPAYSGKLFPGSTGKGLRGGLNVYAELGAWLELLGGSAPICLTVNVDRRFTAAEKGFGFRAGVGNYFTDEGNYFTIPLGLNFLAGSNGHYFESGAGVYISNRHFGYTGNLAGYVSFGYRWQRYAKRGPVLKVSMSPIIEGLEIPVSFYPALGVGYKF